MRRGAWVLLAVALAGCATPTPVDGLPAACPEAAATQPFALRDLDEASGLARSGREPCLLWAHDDSGNPPLLFATDARGRHLGSVRLAAPAEDWEDLAGYALDGIPHLLVADVGNNFQNRRTVALYDLEEPALGNASAGPERGVRTIEVAYPATPFNCEAVAVDPALDQILFVSKGTGPEQALYSLRLSEALRTGQGTLAFEAAIPGLRAGTPGLLGGTADGAVTAMDLRPDRGAIALLTYREVLVWPRAGGQSWAEALEGPPTAVPVPPEGAKQMEALAYSADGAWLFVGAEDGAPNSMLAVVAAPAV